MIHGLGKSAFLIVAAAAGLLAVDAALPPQPAGPAWQDKPKDVSGVLARRSWWAFQKPVSPPVPKISSPWVRTPIDAFLLEAMRAKKLTPSRPLDRISLLRRVTLDLTGLPPTPAEIDFFLADRSPDAYEKTVTRLMASPHYGERWGLRWLDIVRYGDTNGYELDLERPHAWRYRDYVVRSFNQDKPYDRFLKEQLAGDELYPGNKEALVATGFHRAGPIHLVGGNQDEEMNRQEVLTEMTAGVSSVFLGLTAGCARCHNHKFDPILQSDYYRLQAVLGATDYKDIEIATEAEKAAAEQAIKDFEARLKPIKDQIDAIDKPYRERLIGAKKAKLDPKYLEVIDLPKEKLNEEQKRLQAEAKKQTGIMWDEVLDALSPEDMRKRQALRDQMHEMERRRPLPVAAAYAVANYEKENPPTHVLKIGDHKHKLGTVTPGVPLVLGGDTFQVPADVRGRRAALAEWFVSPDQPLTARVMVNRIWQFRMGTGIVRTPNDFGMLGERPTNLALLDYLATEFREKGWSVKAIDRMIVLSSAYQQSAAGDAQRAAIDGENKLYWRMNHKRMEGEIIRDNILAATGALTPLLGGPPVKVPLEPEVYDLLFTEGERDGLWPVNPDPNQLSRRSIYLLNKRTVRLPMLLAFDQPDAMSSCPVRPTSTHALQALSLFNSDFMAQQSARFAQRLEAECGKDAGCALRRAYKLTLARLPMPKESAMATEFFAKGGKWNDFCLAMLNRNEFVYVP